MTYAKLDTIVRSVLFRRGYSLHWYVDFLKAAADCLRELTFDVLKNVETKVLEVSDTGIVKLPCDYVDWVRVGTASGQQVRSAIVNKNMNRLVNRDDQGQAIPYPNDNYSYGGYYYDWYWCNGHTTEIGIFRERGEIQLSTRQAVTIILEYIGNGSCPNNATKIHPYAQAAIEAYIIWQLKEQNRTYSLGERQLAQREYDKEVRRLRIRLSDLKSTQQVIDIFNKHSVYGLR